MITLFFAFILYIFTMLFTLFGIALSMVCELISIPLDNIRKLYNSYNRKEENNEGNSKKETAG